MNGKNLWERIQKNDHKALRQVFDLYYQLLYSYCIQFTHNESEADDIVQEAFIKLWTKRETIQIKTSLKSYLFRTTYHIYVDSYRSKKKKLNLMEELKYEALTSQIEEDPFENNRKISKLKDSIQGLPTKCKEILMLSKREGLKNREIALKLNVSIKTVESQLRIAFQKIRKDFKSK